MKITLVGRYKNGLLLDVLRDRGWNQRQFADAMQVSPSRVSQWLLLQDYPRASVLRQRLEEVTGRLVEDLFPPGLVEALRENPPPPVEVSREVDSSSILAAMRHRQLLASPEAILLEQEQRGIPEQLLGVCSAREQEVLRRRFGLEPYDTPQSLVETGQACRLSPERIRQIEVQTLRKLRYRFRSTEKGGPV